MPGTTEAAHDALPAAAAIEILNATVAVLKNICGRKPDSASTGDSPQGEGLSATIRYAGDLSFELALGIPRDTAKPLATKFAGVPIDYDCDVMADLIGEVANVIAGAVAARLDLAGFATDISLPDIAPTLDEVSGRSVVERSKLDAGFGPMWLTIRVPSSASDRAVCP